ncbi:MAG: diguanylate cyclase domain-containing protein [Allorhizobium sp.]
MTALLDTVALGSVAIDGRGRIRAVNRIFADDIGIEPATCAGQPITNFLHADDRTPFSALVTAAILAPDAARSMELRLIATAHRNIHAIANLICRPQSSGSGDPLCVIHFTDISALKKREMEIASRERRWNHALTGSASGVWDQYPQTGEMYYSDTWRAIRGIAPDGPIAASQQEWLTLIHPDDREPVIHCIERQNAGDPDYTVFEYRERHSDGHWIWIECRGACVETDAQGRPVRIIGTDTDITQRKTAEEAHAQMARRLELALNTSNIGVFEMDLDTRAVFWDDRLVELYGIGGSGRNVGSGVWERLLHPDDREIALSHRRTTIDKGNNANNEYRIIRPLDGEIRHLRSRAATFTDHNGCKKVLGVTWDVTQDVMMRQELERTKILTEARNCELEIAKERIEHIALHDHLTNLPNRRYLDEMLDSLAQDPSPAARGLAILHIDLDRFKEINDTLGHSAGDAMLRHAGAVLKSNIRSGDFVARIGGDEFVVLARFDGSVRKLEVLAARINAELRRPVVFEGNECHFGASIGIACAGASGIDARQLLLNADIALYHAKNTGRDRFVFFTEEPVTSSMADV